MGAKLSKFIETQIALTKVKTMLWTDSAVALSWIRSESRSLKPFVANRVSSIQELTDNDQWHHIDGKDNPADLASRGFSVQELLKPDNIWFMGPTMLNQEQVEFPTQETRPDQNVVNKERKKVQLNFHTENHDYNVRSRIYDAHFATNVIKERHRPLPRRITKRVPSATVG